jgi:YVTN family beta-propeller protein
MGLHRRWTGWTLVLGACGTAGTLPTPNAGSAAPSAEHRLPTGVRLDPAGRSTPVGNMPLAVTASPDGHAFVLSLGGWRQQGIQILDRRTGTVIQEISQPGAFLGLAWATDGRTLYASGGVADAIYVYAWHADQPRPAVLVDSIVLARSDSGPQGRRYPAGITVSPDGRLLYVVENLSDSLAVVDPGSRRVVQRVSAGPYPYGVVAAPDKHVFVSNWGSGTLSVFRSTGDGRLSAEHPIDAGRHPSALLLSADGRRLFVASASTDRIAVVDPAAHRVLRWLADPPPGGVSEGNTPNALALSPDGGRLYVAEADANAIAVFRLSGSSSGADPGAAGSDSLLGRIPTEWYPTALLATKDSLWVVNGKGRGAGPNPHGPQPDVSIAKTDPHTYVLGQLSGTLLGLPIPADAQLPDLSVRVARANGWSEERNKPAAHYPPFEHVIYIIKENRTYDQVLGDLPQADGDTTLLFFPRPVSPNHHALAERFGIFDRFFVNAEVSAQGHPWSTSAYVTDFTEKTTPDDYRSKRPEHDETGEADDPVAGFLWDAALAKGISLRDYGEYAEFVPAPPADSARRQVRSVMASLAPYTSPSYPPFNIGVTDQVRADAWLAEFQAYARSGSLPALEILHLPSDHTAGARPGHPTPKAYMADNDLALGRIIDALSHSRFWRSTVVFVVEDDSQDGPDHVDSHRSVMLAISPWSRGGVWHRFVNTTDVLATIEEILGLTPMSSFDFFGRPLRDIWVDRPDLRPFTALVPAQSLSQLNLASGPDAAASAKIDLSQPDRIDDDQFNRLLWRAIKGTRARYPEPRRISLQEIARAR